MEVNYYDVLGVERSANEREIRIAYKKMAAKCHPDKNPDKVNEAKEEFIEITAAYKALSDEKRRQEYDLRFSASSEGSGVSSSNAEVPRSPRSSRRANDRTRRKNATSQQNPWASANIPEMPTRNVPSPGSEQGPKIPEMPTRPIPNPNQRESNQDFRRYSMKDSLIKEFFKQSFVRVRNGFAPNLSRFDVVQFVAIAVNYGGDPKEVRKGGRDLFPEFGRDYRRCAQAFARSFNDYCDCNRLSMNIADVKIDKLSFYLSYDVALVKQAVEEVSDRVSAKVRGSSHVDSRPDPQFKPSEGRSFRGMGREF